jgi:arabinofuranan 3-O-arabinosyltransferase
VADASRKAPPPARRNPSIPLALAALSFAVALLQRWGADSSDTKIDLHVDPVGFLGDVAALWTNTGSLGEVQGGQYAGYLFPMGPFFALGELVGLAPWVTQRLWLGLLLALGAWGMVRLLDALLAGPRGVAHAVAGVLLVINPYTVVYTQRTSVTLLGLAVLPWLVLATHRGLAEPRRWIWPAAIALLVTASGAAVNAAVTAWILVAPLALVLYERMIGSTDWKGVWSFAWRAALFGGLASAWWVTPVLAQALYGIDFLQFTEQPGAIWSTTSLTESLRLMGYWPSYLGTGYGVLEPFFESSPQLLFEPVVVVATFAVPALALGGFLSARRWAYGPFFLALTLLGLLVMAAGFPPGAPLRRGVTFVYNHVEAVQFLRTTHKAGPLVVLGLACLGGAGAAAIARSVSRSAAIALGVGAAALLAVSVWPLTRGQAVDERLTWEQIPSAWSQTADDLERDLPDGTRAMVLPGQLFGFYDWGGTVDPILPALTDRPVAVRQFVPRADLHAVDVLWAVDALVQQERLVPGQLRPLLDLLGVGAVVAGSDDAVHRSGAIPAADAARALAAQGLSSPDAEHGPRRRHRGLDGGYGPAPVLAQVRRYDLGTRRPLVRVQPVSRPLLVDGAAGALTGLAAFGALSSGRTIEYAADRDSGQLRAATRRGADVVISDSNRRRVFVTARLRQTAGPTLAAGERISEDSALLDPFSERGDAARTVAVYEGARYLRAPYSPGFPQYPEHRPIAAFDGSEATEWLADSHLDSPRHWIEIGFDGPTDVPFIELLPAAGRRTAVAAVAVGGRGFAVAPGWNRLQLGLRDVDSLRINVNSAPGRDDVREGLGIAELRIPGVRVRELIRPPTLAEDALRGEDLRHSRLTYLFERATGDRPFRRDDARRHVQITPPRDNEDPDAVRIRDAGDAETEIVRTISPPVARRYSLDAWVSISPAAADAAIDRLAGTGVDAGFRSSGRFQGLARHRASAAFDGDRARAWVADRAGPDVPWIGWRTNTPRRVEELRIIPAAAPAGKPTRVRVSTEDDTTPPLRVDRDGTIALPRPLTANHFELEVLAATQPGGRGDTPPTVGIAELSGPGVPRATRLAPGRLRTGCGAATVTFDTGRGTRRVGLRLVGTVADLEAGRPLRARGCASVSLPAGRQRVATASGLAKVALLRLRSDAPRAARDPASAGAVLDQGEGGRGRYENVRVRVDAPAWLVLGESFNRGWRASCDDRDLGEPVVVDGYANGWRPPPDCREVEIAFAPQRVVTAGYAVSVVACLALLALLLITAWRGRVTRPQAPPPDLAEGPPPHRLDLRRAATAAVVATAVLAFLFSIRAGVVLGPLVGLVLWRGVGERALIAVAVALLGLVVPAIYLLFPAEDRGGYNSAFAQDLLAAHWVGVAAFVLLALALWQALSRARGRRGDRAPARPVADRSRAPA